MAYSVFKINFYSIVCSILIGFCLSPVSAFDRRTDSLVLLSLYEYTGGPNWTNTTNWKQGPIDTWHGITVMEDRVISIDLNSNALQGELPENLGKLSELQILNLNSNQQLSGFIPTQIKNLTKLTQLQLQDNAHFGTIPNLETLTSLEYLRLENNNLTLRSVPLWIGKLPKLVELAM